MPLTRYYTTDNAQSTLKVGISGSTTTIILQDWEGDRFPSSFPFWAEFAKWDGTSILKRELVTVSNRVWDVLTVTRGAGACLPSSTSNTRWTTQYSFDVGDSVTHILTPQQIEGISASVQDLETTKLNWNGWYRTGLGAKKVLVTDASGNETEVSWTTGQVLGFGAGNVPEAMSPSVDIHGQTQKTTPIGADEIVLSDSEASWVNKKALLKDLVIIADQTAQSAFTGDTDLFVVKQASGGLRKMTVADIRRAFINTWFNTTWAKLIATSYSSITTNVWTYSASYATGSNAWWMISAFFRGYFSSSNYVDVSIQTSPDNSTWSDIWTDTFNANDWYSATMGRAIAMVFNAAYVRIWVRSQSSSWSSYQIHGSATVNLTK